MLKWLGKIASPDSIKPALSRAAAATVVAKTTGAARKTEAIDLHARKASKTKEHPLNAMNADHDLSAVNKDRALSAVSKDLVKIVRNMAEEHRVAVRDIRRDAMKHLKELVDNGEVGADEEHRAEGREGGARDAGQRGVGERARRVRGVAEGAAGFVGAQVARAGLAGDERCGHR